MTIPPNPDRRPVALVTGASAGIGYELAKTFAGHGYDILLVARDRERLENAAAECRAMGARARVIVQDLAVVSAAGEIYEQLQRAGRSVDVLVNNAGLGTHGPFATIPAEADLRLLQVNIVALTQLTKVFLPPMLARGSGRILNVASLASFQAGPLMATYFASKAYVLSFSEAIAQEVSGTGVTVTALCPGPVRTEFRSRAGSKGKSSFGSAMDPGPVARAGYEGMMRGRRVVIPGVRGQMLASLSRLVPRRLATWAAGQMNKIR